MKKQATPTPQNPGRREQERPPVDATEDYPRTRSHGRSSSTAYAPRSRGILSQTREFFMGPREAKGTSRIPDYREEDKLQHTGNLPPPRQEDVKDVRPVNTGQDVPSPREIGISQQINQKEADIKKMQMGTHGLLQRYRSHIHYLEQELAERDAEKEERYAQQLDERDLDIKQLSDSIIKLKKENRELESLVVRAQENALESMLKKTGWSPKEDPMVREEFSKMQMKLRAWAMNNGAITLDYLEKNIPNAEKDKIIRQLSGYCVQTDWQTLITKMSIPRNKIPVVLLQSMLARDIFEGLFADPFFAFTEMGDSDPVLPKSNELKNLYETMREVNEAEAHTWRSQTLRILSTTTNPNSESQLARRTRQLVGQRTASFLTSSASLLLRHASAHEHKEQCIQDLQALYRDAAELALALWTQRTFMRPYSLGGLEKFFVSDPRLLAHRLHHLDEDDTRLDGKNVLLVVQPLVVAFGNEDAENYDRSKIWCPATVVVDESSGPQK